MLRLPFLFFVMPPPPRSTLFPYTTLFRSCGRRLRADRGHRRRRARAARPAGVGDRRVRPRARRRSEEHTSELQSHVNLVCRLLPEKKKSTTVTISRPARTASNGARVLREF